MELLICDLSLSPSPEECRLRQERERRHRGVNTSSHEGARHKRTVMTRIANARNAARGRPQRQIQTFPSNLGRGQGKGDHKISFWAYLELCLLSHA